MKRFALLVLLLLAFGGAAHAQQDKMKMNEVLNTELKRATDSAGMVVLPAETKKPATRFIEKPIIDRLQFKEKTK